MVNEIYWNKIKGQIGLQGPCGKRVPIDLRHKV